jgi:hypothetical protein
LTAGVAAVFSDAFAGNCQLMSSSATHFLCYDGTVIRRYTTTAGSPNLTFVDTVTLTGTALPAAAQCVPGVGCFGGTFAWDGVYYYFASVQNSSADRSYRVYDSSGAYVATDTATGVGGITGTYFDWSVGRYSTHDGYGGRTGGLVRNPTGGGGSDTHAFGPVSSNHTMN